MEKHLDQIFLNIGELIPLLHKFYNFVIISLLKSYTIFKELKELTTCVRFNLDYYDKFGVDVNKPLLVIGSGYPPPLFVHNNTEAGIEKFIWLAFRNPEDRASYTG